MTCTFCGKKAGFADRVCPTCRQAGADRWLIGTRSSYALDIREIERNFFEFDKRIRQQTEIIRLLAGRVYELEKEMRPHD